MSRGGGAAGGPRGRPQMAAAGAGAEQWSGRVEGARREAARGPRVGAPVGDSCHAAVFSAQRCFLRTRGSRALARPPAARAVRTRVCRVAVGALVALRVRAALRKGQGCLARARRVRDGWRLTFHV